MAQHDMNIANQGFPAFRADLNSALTAIANNSSGATEPSTTFAYQWWYDTSTNVLKMRNADNDAWITIGTFNQTTDTFVPAGVTTDKIEEGNSSVEVVDSGTGYAAVVIDGVETARFISGGNFGVGTTSPNAKTEVYGGNLRVTLSAGDAYTLRGIEFASASTEVGSLEMNAGNGELRSTAGFSGYGGYSTFYTNGSERMRIDSDGRLNIGQTTSSPGSGRLNVTPINAVCFATNDTVSYYPGAFYNNGNLVGYILSTASSTSYVTSSDYRLKTDVQPMQSNWDRVKALKPVNFAWKATGERVDGFLAHEVQEVVPEAATGTKDATRIEQYEVSPAVLDDEGNVVTQAVMGTREVPDYQGIDQSKLVPLLTAALQDAITEIESLKARVDALENA